MTRIARLSAQSGITAVLAIALSFAMPVFVDRHAYTKSVSAYVKNPNPENEAIMKLERAENRWIELKSHVVAAGVLFGLMNAGYFLVGRVNKA